MTTPIDQSSVSESSASEMDYASALRATEREAKLTLGLALKIFLVFWLVIFLLKDVPVAFWGLPLWFWLSCVGCYLYASWGIWTLVRHHFVDVDLDRVAEAERARLAANEKEMP